MPFVLSTTCIMLQKLQEIIKQFEACRSLYTLKQKAATANTSCIVTVFGRTVNKKCSVSVARTVLTAAELLYIKERG